MNLKGIKTIYFGYKQSNGKHIFLNVSMDKLLYVVNKIESQGGVIDSYVKSCLLKKLERYSKNNNNQ